MGKKLEPYYKKERPPCPFYGFDGTNKRVYFGSKGNQCALITERYTLCQMEKEGDTPDWRGCPFNTQENREAISKLLDHLRIYPGEFQPPSGKGIRGITLRAWFEYLQIPIDED